MDADLLDLTDRRLLVRSWLATVHGPELRLVPKLTGLPPTDVLLRTAASWQLAYLLMALAGALLMARGAPSDALSAVVAAGGAASILLAAVAIWVTAVGLTSAAWWAGVRRARS